MTPAAARAERVAAAAPAVIDDDDTSQCRTERRPGCGRSCITTVPLPAGTVVAALSSPPWAACLLHARADHRCERCFDLLTSLEDDIGPCPRGCRGSYCSSACREADLAQWAHERALQSGTSPICVHAVISEDLSAASDACSLDRFGTLLLAARCLWRRRQLSDEQSRHEAATNGSSSSSSSSSTVLLQLFDALASGPTSADDLELGTMAAALRGFLPAGDTARDVVRVIGQLRANYACFTDEGGATIGAALYPRQSRLNHSCAPNAVLSFGCVDCH